MIAAIYASKFTEQTGVSVLTHIEEREEWPG